jgi:hypothetical protein
MKFSDRISQEMLEVFCKNEDLKTLDHSVYTSKELNNMFIEYLYPQRTVGKKYKT